MLDLMQLEAEMCDCGFHPSIANTDPDLIFDARVCPVCAGVAVSSRIQGARDEKARKRMGDKPAPATPDPADGRKNFLRSPTAKELQARAADPKT